MADPRIGSAGLTPIQPTQSQSASGVRSAQTPEKDFKAYMLESLEKVNQLQTEADIGVQKLLTGETDNMAEVFSATRKAGAAFDLLMQIRNKLMDAYNEVQQMRV